MKWDDKQPSRFYLIERESGQCIARYTADSFFSFHHVNAYESDDSVFVDVCCYPDASIVYEYYLSNLRTKPEHEVGSLHVDMYYMGGLTNHITFCSNF